jgi:hypothetical protein
MPSTYQYDTNLICYEANLTPTHAWPGDGEALRSFRGLHCGKFIVQFPFQPLWAKQLDWMLRAYRPIPAAKIIRRAVLVASPANALRMLRI